jgi:hypothetical protein
MGVDNLADLVYGWIFSFDEISEFFSLDDGEDFEQGNQIFQKLEELLEKYDEKNFVFGKSSPYYDSPVSEHTFYLSFNIDELEHEQIFELFKKNQNGIGKMEQYKVLKELGITEMPKLYALPNVI